MSNYFLYKFSTAKDGRKAIEADYVKMKEKIRHGKFLSPEEADWFDWAEKELDSTSKSA